MSGNRTNLTKYAWLSIAAAVVTIALKMLAWQLTGSVGLLSDAAESTVNLVAAIMALFMLMVAARPADDNHHFGHHKAEYFSAAVEGFMIFVAAVVIIASAIDRLINPLPLESVGVGAAISSGAAVINGVVGTILIRAGRKYRSITLVADGKHLWTDVVTSIGVVAAIGLIWLTKWEPLDPIIALVVGVNIIITGAKLIKESTEGLMDSTLPEEENTAIAALLSGFSNDTVRFHGLRTRLAGSQRFANVDMLVPGDWSVQRSHDLIEEVVQAVDQAYPGIQMQVHLEPLEDPRAYADFPVEVPIPSNGDQA